MARAFLYYSEKFDQAIELQPGANSFGSGFSNDVVLFDDLAAEDHFVIELSEGGTVLKVTDGDAVALIDGAGEAAAVTPGETCVLTDANSIALGNAVIKFEDLPFAAVQKSADVAVDVPSTKKRSALRPILVTLGVGAIATTAYLGLPLGNLSVGQASVLTVSPMQSVLSEPVMQAPKATKDELAKMLRAAGFRPDFLEETNSGFKAQFYVASQNERFKLNALLGNVDAKIAARIFVDDSILNASRLALSLTDKEVSGSKVKSGALTITDAPAAPEWRKEISEMLQRDIPGLKKVSFSGSNQAWKREIDENLAAVWAGSNPYLMMTDGTKIRKGDQVSENAVFNGMKGTSIVLIIVNGKCEEYELT